MVDGEVGSESLRRQLGDYQRMRKIKWGNEKILLLGAVQDRVVRHTDFGVAHRAVSHCQYALLPVFDQLTKEIRHTSIAKNYSPYRRLCADAGRTLLPLFLRASSKLSPSWPSKSAVSISQQRPDPQATR